MSQFTYGPRLGLNLANLSGDDVDNNKMLIGFNIGVLGNYAITDMFSVQAEVLYDTKGAKFEYTDPTSNEEETVNFNLNYINIPIMAKATFGDAIKFFGEIGPTIGFLMSAKYDGETEYTSYEIDPNDPLNLIETKVKYKDSFKGTDFGLVIGAGAVIPAGNLNLLADLRYNFSLGTIAEEPETGDAGDLKNGVISINLGLLFGGE
jgi:hypothetical protein